MKPSAINALRTALVVTAVAFLAPGALAATDMPNPDRGRDALQAGIEKANAGNPAAAMPLLDEAVKLNGRLPQAWLNRGKALLLLGRLDSGIKDIEKALKIDPNLIDGYIALGLAYKAKGDFMKAVKEYSRAVKIDPKNPDALLNRAAVYFDSGEPESAIEDLNKLIQLDPSSTIAISNRAYILEQLARYDDAIKDLTVLLSQDPNNLQAAKHLAFALAQKGDLPRAEKWYRQALKLEKNQHRKKQIAQEIKHLEQQQQRNAKYRGVEPPHGSSTE
jgi:tetratricopeptide (TPR) repeat protein